MGRGEQIYTRTCRALHFPGLRGEPSWTVPGAVPTWTAAMNEWLSRRLEALKIQRRERAAGQQLIEPLLATLARLDPSSDPLAALDGFIERRAEVVRVALPALHRHAILTRLSDAELLVTLALLDLSQEHAVIEIWDRRADREALERLARLSGYTAPLDIASGVRY